MLPNTEIFGIFIDWYTFFPKLGLLAAIIFAFWYYFIKADFHLSFFQLTGITLLLFVLMMVGGRIVGVMEAYLINGSLPDYSLWFKGPSAGGFRWCGSLLMVLLFFPFSAKKIVKTGTFNSFFDLLVLCFCVFTIFIKQACQFSGDGCYGIATTLPWGMHYLHGIAPSILPVHPTPIYDSLFHLIFFVLLLNWDLKRKKVAGQTSKIYFITVPVFYILLEVLRLNPVVTFGITLPQLVYALVLFAGIPVFKNLLREKPEPETGRNILFT